MITSSVFVHDLQWENVAIKGTTGITTNCITHITFGVTLTDSETGLEVTNYGSYGCGDPLAGATFIESNNITKSIILDWVRADRDNLDYTYDQAMRWLQQDIDSLTASNNDLTYTEGIQLNDIPD